MKIGLIDIDSHNFPNLALMKISAYHKTRGDSVEFINYWDSYDRVYMSKVFTFSNEPLECIQSDVIIKGGSGYDLDKKLPNEIEYTYPDYSLYPQYKYAVGFLTRGCSRGCPFCIVNKKEGSSHKVADLSNFWNGQKEIKLLDPNLLESKDREDLLIQLIKSKAYIDFSQGIDIRLADNNVIDLLVKIKIKSIHFAYDRMDQSSKIENMLLNFKDKSGFRYWKMIVYVLVNYETSFKDDLYRITWLKNNGFTPFVMIYDKENCDKKYKYLQRYVNNKRIFRTINSFDDYKYQEG